MALFFLHQTFKKTTFLVLYERVVKILKASETINNISGGYSRVQFSNVLFDIVGTVNIANKYYGTFFFIGKAVPARFYKMRGSWSKH